MFHFNQKPTPPTSKEATLPDTSHISLTIDSNFKNLPRGSNFFVDFTVRNDGQEPVQFYSNGAAVRVEFDKNVIDSHWGGCSAPSSVLPEPELKSLMPQQTITFHIPSSPCGVFLANSAGLTNLTVGFRYLSQDIPHSVSTSKIFQIS